MRNVRTFFLLLLFVVPVFTVAQVNAINFKLLPYYSPYQNSISDTSFELKSAGDYKIDVLRFYISNIRFFNKESLVYQEQNSFHLCDAAIPNSNRFLMRQSENIVYDKLQFDIGIDSVTNVSGALGGALDPTNGMYWTWQNGYINFKMEGKEDINGKECTVASFSSEQMQGKVWVWKQIPMKTELNVVGKTITSKLISLDENPSIPSGTFEIPSDVLFNEMQLPATAEK